MFPGIYIYAFFNALHPVAKENEDKGIHDPKKCHCHPGADGCRFPTATKVLQAKVHSRFEFQFETPSPKAFGISGGPFEQLVACV